MKKFILGLTSCVALVGSAFMFAGCSNDKALNSVVDSWNKILASDYIEDSGAVNTSLIKNASGVKNYITNAASQKGNMYFLANHESFLNNAMFALRDLSSISSASYKNSLSSSDLKKLNTQLNELNTALTNYTKQIDSMSATINAGSSLLYGDYDMYESLASIAINEAIEASDVYLDMVYNNALNCQLDNTAKEVSVEVANAITQKLNLECAKSYYNIYHNLTGFEKITLARGSISTTHLANYETTSLTKYTDKVTDETEVKNLVNAQKQIKTAEKAAELIEDIAANFDYKSFKLNFETNYPKNSKYSDSSEGYSLQHLCIKNYSTSHDYARYLNLSNLISIDLDDSFDLLTKI